MGCNFFFSGRLPDIKTQEKVIEFVRQYDPMIDLVVQPDPKVKFRTLVELIGGKGKGKIENEYPFDFFGIIPFCKEVVLEHGQFIFDRTDGGRLVRFFKLPDSYHVPPQYPSYDKPNVELYVSEGGYNRLMGSRDVFALLLNIIRLRWWPDFGLQDDFYVCRDIGKMIREYGLEHKMQDESLDFQGCLALFDKEWVKRHPHG